MIGTGSWKCLCECVTGEVEEEEGELFGPRANGNHRLGPVSHLRSVLPMWEWLRAEVSEDMNGGDKGAAQPRNDEEPP